MGKSDNKKSNPVAAGFKWLINDIKDIGYTFTHYGVYTKISFLIMGFGQIMRKSFARGIGYLACEIAYIYYMAAFGAKYLADFNTLGTTLGGFDENYVYTYGDNSFYILLFSLLSILLTLLMISLWRGNLRDNKKMEDLIKCGKHIPTASEDLKSLLDENFHKTLLAIPITGVFVFMVLPIAFMICVAFTNYDYNHQSPTNLFTWVGFENFKSLFSFGQSGFGSTFMTVLGWTLVWAFFATFLTYFAGMGVAILINKKEVKLKKLWRTILVMTIAIPQFVSLLYVYKMFAADGLVNTYFMKWGWIDRAIPFWTNATYTRVTIILINLWIGIPYAMLICTGLLMNIPADLYESASIDGANPIQMFMKITLPYMLFVTGPYLLTSFTGNLNNFNVIYLLTQGKPQSLSLTGGAGYSDLLVTWLYKMTVNDTNYKMAACIGIMVFIVVAGISLVVYGFLPSVKDEEGFQ